MGNKYTYVKGSDIEKIELTPAKFRELALSKMFSSGPGHVEVFLPSVEELETVAQMVFDAVTAGRMIDFGYWPNSLIKERSGRGGDLYYQGALGHPFRQPWVFCHSWDDSKLSEQVGANDDLAYAFYLVNPFPVDGKAVRCDFEITALETYSIQNLKLLCMGDRAVSNVSIELSDGARYAAQVIPNNIKFPIEVWNAYAALAGRKQGFEGALEDSLSNVMEPLLLALLILNTKGIAQETIRAPEKLQKARIKNKKPPIPDYRKVNSDVYVTSLGHSSGAARRDPLSEHHRNSPIPHIRLGHWRTYRTGEKTFINDTLVKASEEMRDAFKSSRAMYAVKDIG
jgi:hypothetical protein